MNRDIRVNRACPGSLDARAGNCSEVADLSIAGDGGIVRYERSSVQNDGSGSKRTCSLRQRGSGAEGGLIEGNDIGK